jgi:hypothetical protein
MIRKTLKQVKTRIVTLLSKLVVRIMGEGIKFQNESYKKKVSSVENFIKANFGVSLCDFIRQRKWKENTELCARVVGDNLSAEDIAYLNQKLGRLAHLRDRRTTLEYACDLVLGWTIEDAILVILSERLNAECELQSADRERQFLPKPKATSDIGVKIAPGRVILLEVVKDFTGYWAKKGWVDLRDQKYKNLVGEDGVLLGIDFVRMKFFAVRIAETQATYRPSHPEFGGKPVYSISLREMPFHDFEDLGRVLTSIFSKT